MEIFNDFSFIVEVKIVFLWTSKIVSKVQRKPFSIQTTVFCCVRNSGEVSKQ